ncbi:MULTISPECIES: hypothetical protein [unclassified Brevundimonas]|uniref:hypothetical protein n=1 Tax=unclassified Brevundimonas TaxID=2622653 RepID=UPI0010CD4ECB|nr:MULTISPECIES: hypothetical protein [unclassified Brevundimonas]QCQ99135.1 hypothetical protein E7T10_10855 [Brevundimonas sp. SGAir0440]
MLERLKAGSTAYNVEPTGDGGFILVRDIEHAEEFTNLVRALINRPTDEFVILPTSDGHTGYERAVILPL